MRMKTEMTSPKKRTINGHEIANAAGLRVLPGGEIEVLDEREAEIMVANALREALAKAFARQKVH
jgi:hypothetical protein